MTSEIGGNASATTEQTGFRPDGKAGFHHWGGHYGYPHGGIGYGGALLPLLATAAAPYLFNPYYPAPYYYPPYAPYSYYPTPYAPFYPL